ncbi:hypothetical protein ACQ63I_001359 [Enterococcus faecalis]|uniref:hypothetical protein n=1 Tax=Enterococcus faecalis TaxID=1351 RepID=UPI0001F0C749|nr:hypothetical protein [Enterococcus faecalis]EFT95185.1 hypothetical protein HMPREF9499_00628 [Enterococcus faecalis TX0012]EHU8539397.1 hypothetical protein [Enterococcus faecalis]EIQ7148362.1 hypothetical protein [Enterococcus faecalis]
MPHIELKISSLVSEEVKKKLANQFEKDLIEIAGRSSDEISISIEGIELQNWKSDVYDQLIVPQMDGLYKKPKYKI